DVNIVSQAATLKVSIESSLATLDVNIASSAVTLNVAITSSSVTLDVNVTNASLTVNIGAPLTDTGYLASSIVESVQLDVNIAASAVTLNVAITSSSVTLDVNVTNASLTVNIGGPLTTSGYVASEIVKSVQLDVNIAASAVTLNVAIKSSDVTLNVNVTNASLTVNIGGPLSTSGYVQTSIMESVQLDVNIAASAVTLNVAIKSSDVTLNVNVTNASLTVNIGGPVDAHGYVQTHIMDSVQLDVNIAASAVTLNVAIQSSAVTLDVNIASSAVTLDINVTNPVLQVGQAKSALRFNGEGDYVDISDSGAEWDFQTFTVAVWVRTRAKSGGIIGEGYKWRLTVTTGGKVKFWIRGLVDTTDTSDELISNTAINDGRLHLVVALYNVSTKVMQIYIDGVLDAEKTTSVEIYADGGNTQAIGTYYVGSSAFVNAVISNVLIYDRALSATEISDLYSYPQSPPTNGLVAWYNFDEGSGTTLHDKSPYGNHGTIHGATWVSEAGEVPALVNVNLSAQTVTLEVKIVASDVTLNVAIQSSDVTLDVNIASQAVTLDVNIASSDVTLNVAIQSSAVTLDVNIASSSATLNVQITGSTVTLDVNVVGTANVNITDAIVNISALKLMDEGTLLVKSSWCSEGGTTTLYTVPTGKKAYIYLAHLTVKSTSTTTEGNGTLYVYDGTDEYILIKLYVDPDHPCMSDSMAFTLLKLLEGWEVRLYAEGAARCDGSVIIVEVPA
ncbi:MAG: LamG domain-containing protein, partial [Candidatus Thorarchaeota archaeon]